VAVCLSRASTARGPVLATPPWPCRRPRQALTTYAVAFFERYLNGDKRFDRVLNGTVRPLGSRVPVDIAVTAPTR